MEVRVRICAPALDGIAAGDEIVDAFASGLHEAQRDVPNVGTHGSDFRARIRRTGVFAKVAAFRAGSASITRTRRFQHLGSPKCLETDNQRWLHVQGLEAIDGTPVIDIKPVLERSEPLVA